MSFSQSIAWWCYERSGIDPLDLIAEARAIGYAGFEMAPPALYQPIVDGGLRVVAHQLHQPLTQGISHAKYHDDVQRQAEANFKLAQEWNIPCLIVFSGNREGISDEAGAINAIRLLQKLARDAESAGVTLILELLNSKLNHPDYQCDSTPWGVEVVSAVDSPAARLLYDIYHMQIMEGDVIQTIRDNHQWIAHYHTAGVPGRNELNQTQELYYPAICQAIADTGFDGYLGQEFVPTADWRAGLREAFRVCDVA